MPFWVCVLPIFNGVIMDGHPIFRTTIIILNDGQNTRSHLLFSFLFKIVLFLHFIDVIYLSKLLLGLLHHLIGVIWIITPLMIINVSIQETKIITCYCVNYVCIQRVTRDAVYASHLFRDNRGFARRVTHLYAHDFAPLLGFLFVWRGMEKNNKTKDRIHTQDRKVLYI